MKTCKSLVALFLTVCLLIGMPLSVSAVGTTTPTDLRLIGAQPIVGGEVAPGDAIHTNSSWKDAGLMLYFNQKVAKIGAVRTRLVVVDSNNEIVTYGGKRMVWNMGSHGESVTNSGLYCYIVKIDSNRQNISYEGDDMKTWSSFINMLANAPELAGKGYRLQVRFYDYTAGNNSFVDSMTAVDTSIKLAATGYDATDMGTGISNMNYAAVDIGTVAAGSTTITRTGVVAFNGVKMQNDTYMTLNFSADVTIDTARTTAEMQVVKADGNVISYPVTLNNSKIAKLKNHTWADIAADQSANDGSYVRLKLTEKNVAAARDERFNNYAVDTVWSTDTLMPLQGDLNHIAVKDGSTAKTADYVYGNVEEADDQPKVLSAEIEEINKDGKIHVLVTFNEPVTVNTHTSSVGYANIMVRFNENLEYGTDQRFLKDFEYVAGEPEADGKTYAEQIRFIFNMTSNKPLVANAGFGVYEYDLQSQWSDGQVSPNTIANKEGKGLAYTHMDSGYGEASFTTLTLAEDQQQVLSISCDSATQITVKFSMHVSAIDVTNVMLGECKAVSASGSADTWVITLDREMTASDLELSLPAGSVTIGYSSAFAKPMQVSLDPWAGYEESEELINLEDKPYHFMNADTGRSLALADGTMVVEEFILVRESEASNKIALKYGDRYVNLHNSPATLGEVPHYYLLTACEYDRYRLFINPNTVVADGDEGTTNMAETSLMDATNMDIATGWYLTASGDTRPLRVMPLGDSITYGVNDTLDNSEYRVSYREQLSEDLVGYFGRVVFVGSQKTKNNSGAVAVTTVNESRLLRHEGHSGWVVDGQWYDTLGSETDRQGLDSIIDSSMEKYSPDIVCLMIGTNDLGAIKPYTQRTETDLQDNISNWIEVYGNFVGGIEESLSDNGLVICSSITPNKNDSWNADHKAFGEAIMAKVEEMAADGAKVCIADNYTAVADVIAEQGADAVFADSVHLKAAGSQAMAEEYLEVIQDKYDPNSKKALSLQEQLNAGNAMVALTRDYTVDEIMVPDGVTLDLNGHVLMANIVIANVGNGNIIDSQDGKGGIKIALDKEDPKLLLCADNKQLPLYDSSFGGYRFFACTVEQMKKDDTCMFGFRFVMNQAGYALLADPANADMTLKNDLVVSIDGTETRLEYLYKESTLKTFAKNMTDEPARNWAIILTIRGFDRLTGDTIRMSSTPTLVSSTGVKFAAATAVYDYKGE